MEETKTEEKKDNYLIQAQEAANVLKAENAKMEKHIQELRELKAFQIMGGQSTINNQEKPKEETPIEYRDRIQKELREGKYK